MLQGFNRADGLVYQFSRLSVTKFLDKLKNDNLSLVFGKLL